MTKPANPEQPITTGSGTASTDSLASEAGPKEQPGIATPDPTTSTPAPSPAAERMRRLRQRKRDGLRFLGIEIRETEIDALVRRGLLPPEDRNDRYAIRRAVHRFLERTLGAKHGA